MYFFFSSIEEGYEIWIDGILFGKKLLVILVELFDSIYYCIDWLMNVMFKVIIFVLVEKLDSYKWIIYFFERGSW